MVKMYSAFLRIDNNQKITVETAPSFLYHLQIGVLLALKEHGTLNTMQYRYAEEKLKHQRQNWINSRTKRGNHS